MISFPNCKINIGLQIKELLSDGYHAIETCIFPIPLNDILEIVPAANHETKVFLSGTNERIPTEKNIVYKAWKLMNTEMGIPAVDIYLHKVIPSGAGLGGGSADAVFTLKMLNSMFTTGLTDAQLELLAAKLGMDCPFFLRNTPQIAGGRGEILNSAIVDLSGFHLLLIKPSDFISTAEAYAGVVPQKPQQSISELIQAPVKAWKDLVVNDFEKTVFEKHPEIAVIKAELYKMGAVYAQMSGSGSAIYGLFSSKPELMEKFKNCFVYETLLGRF